MFGNIWRTKIIGKRLVQQLIFGVINSPLKREDYLNFDNVYLYGTFYVSRKILLYDQLISVEDNVIIGSNVIFCTYGDYYAVVCNRTDKG